MQELANNARDLDVSQITYGALPSDPNTTSQAGAGAGAGPDGAGAHWLERLGPVNEGEIFRWEAVMRGTGLGNGYQMGRWRVDFTMEEAYPNRPPVVRFGDRCCHANVNFATGEICLDLLKDAWTPAYTILTTLEAIRMMLMHPEVDSPLNVDLAALIRQGDTVGAESLVRFYTESERYEGR